MTSARAPLDPDLGTLARMPSWVTSGRGEAPKDVAFLSGAALSHLHLVVGQDEIPQALLRERLALSAAEACVAFAGRPERAGELRDAVHLLRPGDQPGPAGEIYLTWRRAVERPVSIRALHRALPFLEPEQIASWLNSYLRAGGRDTGRGAPVTRAALVLEAVLSNHPHGEAAALILADVALAQALGWKHVLPLLATNLGRGALRQRGEELRLACHRAVTKSAGKAARLASDLSRRTHRLKAIAPKLRAKGAGAAVEMFLTRDPLAPAALASLNSDRAARRFCDRLVELDVVHDLTGRDTFRLYGV